MHFFEFLSVFFISSVKFFFAVPLAVNFDFTFWQTLLITCFGGTVGVLFFAQFRTASLNLYHKFFPKKKNKGKQSTFKNKLANKTARKYGLAGIAFLTPIVFSIPFGTFIALHFFPNKRKTIPVLLASVLFWSLALTLVFNINV